MKLKKILIAVLLLGSMAGSCYGYLIYQDNCNIEGNQGWLLSDGNSNYGLMFENLKYCPGDYILEVSSLDKDAKVNMTTSTSDTPGMYTRTPDSEIQIKQGDSFGIDKNVDTFFQFENLSDKETQMTVDVTKK